MDRRAYVSPDALVPPQRGHRPLFAKCTVHQSINWLQYFAPEELEMEFVEAGFSIEALYSDVAGTPYDRNSSEFAIIAKRV